MIAATDAARDVARLYLLDGAAPRPVLGLMPHEAFSWTSDPRFLYVNDRKQASLKIYRLDILTGERRLFNEMAPADAAGLCEMSNILFSADGKAYVYQYVRWFRDLYLVKGLK